MSTPARCAPPFAVFVGGPPASGKSTLARALAPRLGAALLDLDVVTGPLTDVVLRLAGARDLGDPDAARLTREPRYRTLLDLALETVRVQCPVVLVAPFTAEREAARWASATAAFDGVATTHLIWLELPADELARRLISRGATRDEHRFATAAEWAAGWDARPPAVPHLLLDARRPLPELVGEVLQRVA